jgi:predicted nucleic acid-binding protein
LEPVCSDPDDDKFLACAIAGGSKIIVSGDKHLLKISGFQGIEILKPQELVNRYLRTI